MYILYRKTFTSQSVIHVTSFIQCFGLVWSVHVPAAICLPSDCSSDSIANARCFLAKSEVHQKTKKIKLEKFALQMYPPFSRRIHISRVIVTFLTAGKLWDYRTCSLSRNATKCGGFKTKSHTSFLL